MLASDLRKNGVVVIENFLDPESTSLLLDEVKRSTHPNFALSPKSGYIRSISPGRMTYEIPDAANSLRSINLLELAIDIRDLILSSETNISLKLTMLSAARDHNLESLDLHSDNLDLNPHGMYRAILYLNDVNKSNGAFRYSIKSHCTDHQYSHFVNNNEFIDDIIECIAPAGSLVLFNAYGIHGRNPCLHPRYSLSFEFLPECMAKRNNSVSILQGNLSNKVLDNIHLFSIVGSDPNKNHLYDQLTDKFYCPTTYSDFIAPTYSASLRRAFKILIKTFIGKFVSSRLRIF